MKRLLILLFLIFVSFSFTKARSADHKMQGSQSKSHNNGDLEGKASAKQTSVERHGYLSVQNGKMVDQHGFQPQLRGISFSWSIWEGEKYYNKEVVDWLVDDFKVDLDRKSTRLNSSH